MQIHVNNIVQDIWCGENIILCISFPLSLPILILLIKGEKPPGFHMLAILLKKIYWIFALSSLSYIHLYTYIKSCILPIIYLLLAVRTLLNLQIVWEVKKRIVPGFFLWKKYHQTFWNWIRVSHKKGMKSYVFVASLLSGPFHTYCFRGFRNCILLLRLIKAKEKMHFFSMWCTPILMVPTYAQSPSNKWCPPTHTALPTSGDHLRIQPSPQQVVLTYAHSPPYK